MSQFRGCLGSPWLLIVLAMLLTGCAKSGSKAASDYETVAPDPHRNTEKAQRENAKALDLIQEQKYDQAEKHLKDALAADLMFGPAHNNLGKVYYHQARYYLAAWEFQYAAKLMTNKAEPRNNLGLVFEAVGKLDQAIEAYQDARHLNEEDPQIAGNLARARLKRGDKSPDIRPLLEQVVLQDDRPQWVQWARQRLSRLDHAPQTQQAEP